MAKKQFEEKGPRLGTKKGWMKPHGTQVKVNWDVALNNKVNTTGLGGLIRDSRGEVLISFCCCVQHHLQPVLVEVSVLRRTMTICLDLNISNIFFEGDYLQVVKAVNSPQASNTKLNPFIFDIQLLLLQNSDWQVCYAHKGANQVAHVLAKLACSVEFDRIWIEQCPSIVHD